MWMNPRQNEIANYFELNLIFHKFRNALSSLFFMFLEFKLSLPTFTWTKRKVQLCKTLTRNLVERNNTRVSFHWLKVSKNTRSSRNAKFTFKGRNWLCVGVHYQKPDGTKSLTLTKISPKRRHFFFFFPFINFLKKRFQTRIQDVH